MADDVPNRGPQLLGVNYFFAVLAFLTVLLRSYVRAVVVKRFALDDWVMLVAMVIFELYCSFSIGGVYHGTGRHHVDLEEDQIKAAMRFWWLCYLSYAMAMMASKISISIFLLRLVFERSHKWILYGAMAISIIAGTTFFFITLFQCNPISLFWDQEQDGKCLNPQIVVVLAIIYSVLAIISDLTFVILPIFLLWDLNMRRRAKLALVPLLSMGCIASAAVVVRFPYLLDLNSPDFLWDTLDTAIWSTVEQGLAISAGSLATTRPLFRLAAERFGWTTRPSANQARADELSLPHIQKKTDFSLKRELPPTKNETLGDGPYGHRVSIRAGENAVPGAPQQPIVATRDARSADRRLHTNESEEWLARTDGRTFI